MKDKARHYIAVASIAARDPLPLLGAVNVGVTVALDMVEV